MSESVSTSGERLPSERYALALEGLIELQRAIAGGRKLPPGRPFVTIRTAKQQVSDGYDRSTYANVYGFPLDHEGETLTLATADTDLVATLLVSQWRDYGKGGYFGHTIFYPLEAILEYGRDLDMQAAGAEETLSNLKAAAMNDELNEFAPRIREYYSGLSPLA